MRIAVLVFLPVSWTTDSIPMCLNENIRYIRYVLLVITAWLKVCDDLKVCLFCSYTWCVYNQEYLYTFTCSKPVNGYKLYSLIVYNLLHDCSMCWTSTKFVDIECVVLWKKILKSPQLTYQSDFRFISFRCTSMMNVNLQRTYDDILHSSF